jgi:hypothetical protein
MRGICEDFISLKFIYEYLPQQKDEIIGLSALAETYKSSISQWKFFTSKKPSQFLYYRPEFETELIEIREKLKTLLYPHPVKKKDHLPSVWYMAEKTGLSDVYQYIYHASSSFVHFNPRILLRMGWGDLPEVTFSSKNFSKYYKNFLVFYGTYLNVELVKWAISIHYLKSDDELRLKPFEDFLKKNDRWPELVTFEEMNVGTLSKILSFGSPKNPHVPMKVET